jgi:hypothetical protein
MEGFRLVFVSLGALGLFGYLMYVALSEDTFRLPQEVHGDLGRKLLQVLGRNSKVHP